MSSVTTRDVKHDKILLEVCKSDMDAFSFLKALGHIFRKWDDVWDGDRKVSRQDIDDCLSDAFFGLSSNAFYKVNRDVLDGAIFMAWNAWQDSNVWNESVDKKKSTAAFFIRDFCNEIVQLVAFLIGGKDHARSISLNVREFYLNELD